MSTSGRCAQSRTRGQFIPTGALIPKPERLVLGELSFQPKKLAGEQQNKSKESISRNYSR